MFGAFECTGDLSVARAMDDAAISWLAARGMSRVRGPINPVSECWGLLLEGFDDPPVFMAPYNPKRYNDLLTSLGYEKAKDLLAYEGSPERGYRIPRRFSDFGERTLRNDPGLRVRPLDMKKSRARCRLHPLDHEHRVEAQLGLRADKARRVPGDVPQAEDDRRSPGRVVRGGQGARRSGTPSASPTST